MNQFSILSPQSSLLSLVQQILQLEPHVVLTVLSPDRRPVAAAPINIVIANANPPGVPKRPVQPWLHEIRPRPVKEEDKAGPQVAGQVLRADGQGGEPVLILPDPGRTAIAGSA